MSEERNIESFHQSTTDELMTIKNRVRNLIGNTNWGEEGRYKEAILKNVIQRFLPRKYNIGTGFIVRKENNEIESSHQIDILIVDSDYPVLFSEGDFMITDPRGVKALIEVKTNIENSKEKMDGSILKMNENSELIEDRVTIDEGKIFNGIFSFEGYDHISESTIKRHLDNGYSDFIGRNGVNFISLNSNIFIRKKTSFNQHKFEIFNFERLSFTYFISNLIDTIQPFRKRVDYSLFYPYNSKMPNLWFSHVIPFTPRGNTPRSE